jgi:hypothetical protein
MKTDREMLTGIRANSTYPAIVVYAKSVDDCFQWPGFGANKSHPRQAVIVTTIDTGSAKSTTRRRKIHHRETLLIVFDNLLGATRETGVTSAAKFDKLRGWNSPGRVALVRITRQASA